MIPKKPARTRIKSGASCDPGWEPVSRLREALVWFGIWVGASAGEGRSEKIMLQQYFKTR
jgi:hypothetical protein